MKIYGFQDRFYKKDFRSLLIYDLVNGLIALTMVLFGFWIIRPLKRIQLSVSTLFLTTLQRTTTIKLLKVKNFAVEREIPINGNGIKLRLKRREPTLARARFGSTPIYFSLKYYFKVSKKKKFYNP